MAKEDATGRTVVITGASSGFGRGAALRFAREGANLVLAARRADLLEELVAECAHIGGMAIAVPTDVSKADEVERLADTALREMGRIDVWVNDAGVGAIGPFERIPLADHQQVIATDLLGTLYGSWFAYRHFLERGHGVLINIASELGAHASPYYTSYTAAKHGVVGLCESLRQEIDARELDDDIHVCTVLPTAHDTPFFEHAANYSGHEVKPPKPLHDPDEVVDAIVALAKDPKNSKIVGGDGPVKIFTKNLMPRVAEKMSTKQMHKNVVDAPPAADSPGAARRPTRHGRTVDAGNRRRK